MSSPSTVLPRHIAIIMDGNRRWAKNRFMPAALGHAAGARRVREIGVYCELWACDAGAADIKAFNPSGIILSGGPSSVTDEGAPTVPRELLDIAPVLGVAVSRAKRRLSEVTRKTRAPCRFASRNRASRSFSSALVRFQSTRSCPPVCLKVL